MEWEEESSDSSHLFLFTNTCFKNCSQNTASLQILSIQVKACVCGKLMLFFISLLVS